MLPATAPVGPDTQNPIAAPIEPPVSSDPNLDSLERWRANSLLEALQLSGGLPRYIHNLRLETSIGKEYYDDIDAPIQKGNKAKKKEFRIDGNDVIVLFYRNGTIQMQTACTKKPFKIETLDDEVNLTSNIGYVRGFVSDHLADRRGVIVPKTSQWMVVEHDINIDVPVTDSLLQTFPSIQMYPDNTYRMQLHGPIRFPNFMETLRVYAKSLGGAGVMRFEELRTPLALVPTVIHRLFHPNADLERKVDYLTYLIKQKYAGNCDCASHHNARLIGIQNLPESSTSCRT